MTIDETKRILVTGAAGCAGSATTVLLRSKGYNVVAHARRAAPGIDWVADLGSLAKADHDLSKRWMSCLFYRAFNLMSGMTLDWNVGNFRIFSDRVASAFREMREQLRYLLASLNWMGFEVGTVELPHHRRPVGESSYTFWKLFRLAGNAIVAHSQLPLKITALFGLVTACVSFIAALFIVIRALIWGGSVIGWPSLIVSMFMLGGIQVFLTGIVGLYVGKCFEEAKRRPLYIVRATSNL